MTLHPDMQAALDGPAATIFAALKIVLPDAEVLRLLDASAEIEIGGELYAGTHALGAWKSLEPFEDGTGDAAPGAVLRLLPADDAAATTLSDPAMQGGEVTLMIGARNNATGLVIGEPYVMLFGEVDVPRHLVGLNMCEIELECVGGMERLFFEDEGIRLAQSFHEQVWPGEIGLQYITGVTQYDYWGMKNPPPGVTNVKFANGSFAAGVFGN